MRNVSFCLENGLLGPLNADFFPKNGSAADMGPLTEPQGVSSAPPVEGDGLDRSERSGTRSEARRSERSVTLANLGRRPRRARMILLDFTSKRF